MAISETLLKEWKEYMNITYNSKDVSYRILLQSAVDWVDHVVGGPPTENEDRKKTLAFNRARFDFNGDLEYFSASYQSEIFDLSLKYKVDEYVEEN